MNRTLFGAPRETARRDQSPEADAALPPGPESRRLWPASPKERARIPPHRTPMLFYGSPGSFLSRFATRAFLGLLFQVPPRSVGGLVPMGPFPQDFSRAATPPQKRRRKEEEKRKKNKGKLIPPTPETDAAVMVRRYVPGPVRRTREPGTAVPRTAAQRSGRPTRWALRICRTALRVVRVPIRHPL